MDKKTIISEYLKMTFAMIPIYLLIGCFILWSYLNDIDMLSIFTSIIDAKSALVALMVSFLFISISLILIFTLPSILLSVTYLILGYDGLRRVIKIERIPWLAILSSILILLSLIISGILSIDNNIVLIMVTILFPVIFCAVHITSRKRDKVCVYFKNGKIVKRRFFIKDKAIISFFILFSGLAITTPLSFIIDLSSANSYIGIISFTIISIFMIFIAFFPTIIFYSEGLLKLKNSNAIIYSVIPAFLFFLLMILILPNFSSIVSRGALVNIGVVEKNPHLYMLRTKDYDSNLFSTLIWGKIEPINKNSIFLKGTVLLSLGDHVLLCPDFVMTARQKHHKYNLDDLFSSKIGLHSRYLKQMTKSCVLLNKNDITQWDSVMDGKNKLNQ
ncbi:hypothetical protein [Pectobacterium aroidearum]|uniref:hypothetical protein n=2 Tax=Pectobacterium TaxID=122277 RepID=UPI0030167251